MLRALELFCIRDPKPFLHTIKVIYSLAATNRAQDFLIGVDTIVTKKTLNLQEKALAQSLYAKCELISYQCEHLAETSTYTESLK